MATKKQQQFFYESMLEYIVNAGAKNRNIGALCTHYKINTKAGNLNITLEEPEKGEVFSIFCRFDDVKKATEFLGKCERLNKYSGKWNFHYFDSNTALMQFKNELNALLN